MDTWFNVIPIVLLVVGLFILIISFSRKVTLIAFLGVAGLIFLINVQFWPAGFATSKLVTSAMAIIILNFSPTSSDEEISSSINAGTLFRIAMLAFGFILILFVSPGVSNTINLDGEQLLTSLFVVVTGLVLISLSRCTFRTVLGLLLVLEGFEILYGAVERSLLVNGLLASIILLIALVGSYLMINAAGEVEE